MYNIYRNTKHDNTERYAVCAEFTGNEDAKKETYSSLSRKKRITSYNLLYNKYNESEYLVIRLGYKEVADSNPYSGRYFIKNGKKWIHNIDDEELEASYPKSFGYDVVSYYIYNTSKNSLLHSNEFKPLMKKVHIN
ncbi:hypothetical protein ACFGWO_08925 [Pasteurella multocida]|uniref:hypothetical protein n=1 Tax=Pasteurella multocida TaxID=747 RepID=UPI000DFBE812|nr:hypothetical protein [Pasteurella multocida]MCL7785999.1 hypothetical protein [Pasteurella multocida]MCL7794731.1 hypothetical protein [Pasteurella multocida]URI03118.1 hypothetical protein M8852_02245 [Pasteurella multocida]SUB46941.1 Uncharacterised protein [Pasteurella multocida subsp. septica]HDR1284620.1 hypothetical protein [Pasteurella multocida]